jgi:hypothetical protein
VIRTVTATERHEEDILAAGAFDLARSDQASGIGEQRNVSMI